MSDGVFYFAMETDHLINKENIDVSVYKNGDFDALDKYLDTLESPKG